MTADNPLPSLTCEPSLSEGRHCCAKVTTSLSQETKDVIQRAGIVLCSTGWNALRKSALLAIFDFSQGGTFLPRHKLVAFAGDSDDQCGMFCILLNLPAKTVDMNIHGPRERLRIIAPD